MHLKPPEITESVSELKKLLRKTSAGYQKQRLTTLYLFRSGQATTRKQVAEPITGESFFLEMPRLDSVCFQIFMDQLAKAFPETLNLLVLDNGRFHHAKSLRSVYILKVLTFRMRFSIL